LREFEMSADGRGCVKTGVRWGFGDVWHSQ
jgi:hypothetical protein